MTLDLEAGFLAADTKQRLEDLYAPYKLKRRIKAQIAREAGLDAAARPQAARPGSGGKDTQGGARPGAPKTAAQDGRRTRRDEPREGGVMAEALKRALESR